MLEVPVCRVEVAPNRAPVPLLRKVRSRLVSKVKPHTRRTKHGTVKVRQHSRKGRLQAPNKRPWKNLKRGRRAFKQRRKTAAVIYGAAAASEVVGFLTLRGGGWTLMAAGVGLAAVGTWMKART